MEIRTLYGDTEFDEIIRYLAGKMSTLIAGMGKIEHYLDLLLFGDMKGLSSYSLAGKMSTPIVDANPTFV